MKIVEYIILAFGIISLYSCGCWLTKEVNLLHEVRTDIDMQLEQLRILTGDRRKADIEI